MSGIDDAGKLSLGRLAGPVPAAGVVAARHGEPRHARRRGHAAPPNVTSG